jgi:nucleolar pre-ribosomal-associated protein 2
LISLVLQIDSDLFSGETMATTLLTEVTSATVDLPWNTGPEPMPHEPPVDTVTSGKDFMDFLRKQVILPVMKAFADRRKLGSFVDMWATQISDNKHNRDALIWFDLAADFAPLLEESLTKDQVLALFNQYYPPMKSTAGDRARYGGTVSPPTLKSSIIILYAVLSGVLCEALSDAVYEGCGELFKSMIGCEYDHSNFALTLPAFPMQSESWNLMTKAFELWFPAWAMAQSDAHTIAEIGTRITKSRTYNIAQFHLLDSGANTTQAAKTFVSCVCAHLHKYDQVDVQDRYGRGMPRTSCLDSINLSFEGGVSDELRWPILLQFPNLIMDLDGDETINLIEDCIRSASPSATGALQALTTSIFQHTNNRTVDHLVETFLLYLSHKKRPGPASDIDDEIVQSLCETFEIATLKAIAGLSPDFISRPHREEMVNAVCARQQAEKHPTWPENPAAQTWRFVVLTSLMKLPNATCKLAVDAYELWRLTKSVIDHPDQRTVPMVEELTVQLSTNLLATQDQERSRSMLIGFAETIRNFFEEVCTNRRVDDGYDAALTVIMTLIVRLEAGSKEELKSKFSYRNPETINSFIAVCLNDITSHTKRAQDRFSASDGYISVDLKSGLKALFDVPEAMLQFAKTDKDLWHGPLLELMESCLTALQNKNKHDRSEDQTSAIQDVIVNGFRTAGKTLTSVHRPEYMTLPRNIAKLHLAPIQRDSFMAAFSLYLQRLPGNQYVRLLDDLLSTLRIQVDATALSILPLVEVCASNLDKAIPESAESPLPKFLSPLLSLTELDPSVVVRKYAMTCVATGLKGNASLVNQYCIEMVLATTKRVLNNVSKARNVYLEMCQVLSIMLLQYRSRLHGRFHLVVEVFQALLSGLFEPTASNPSTDKQERHLTTKHGQAVAKLLTLFCEPPHFKRSSKASALVDEARKEQADVGKFVQYILHRYCSQILNGKLGPGMREALTPGLWSMIEAMEMGEAEGVKTLSAAMNNSERAVLRGVYDDWRRFGKWRGA